MYRLWIGLLLVTHLGMAQKQKHIGFLMDDFYSIRWVKDSTAFAAKVRQLGHRVSIRVCNSDTALQHQQVRDLIAEGVNVIVITAEDGNSAGRIVETAHQHHVPVIAYDRMIMDCDLDYYVSFDASKVGEMQAKFLMDSLQGKGNIMLVNGPKSDPNATAFRNGQMKILDPFIKSGKITLLYDKQISEWTLLEALMETNEFLAENNKTVNGVIAANDELAEGVLEAFAFSRPDYRLVITGQDANPAACKRIMKGTQAMTVFKPVDHLAEEAAVLACNMALGKSPVVKTTMNNGKRNVPFLKLDPILLTHQNIKRYIFDTGYYPSIKLEGVK